MIFSPLKGSQLPKIYLNLYKVLCLKLKVRWNGMYDFEI